MTSGATDTVDAKAAPSAEPAKAPKAAKAAKPAGRGFGFALKRLGKRIFKPANPVFTLMLLAVFVAIIAVVIYLVMQIGTYTITDPIYRYDTGVKVELEGESKVFRAENENQVDFTLQNGGATLELTEKRSHATSPLYWRDEARMFLPAMMSIMRPSLGVQPVRTGYYTELRQDGDGFIAKIDNRDVRVNEGFLFDGQSTYVFLDAVTVSFLGQSVEMPPLSYAVVVSGLRLELYPYGGKPVVEQTGQTAVSAVGGGYLLDMSNDVLQADGGQVLLFTTPSILEVLQ